MDLRRSWFTAKAVATSFMLAAILTVAFVNGKAVWQEKSEKAEFFQTEFSPAVSLACGHGFKGLQSERLDKTNEFLSRRASTLTCAEAFSQTNAPVLVDANVLQNQTISLQYLFAGLWRLFGFDWKVAGYVAGGLLAVYALSTYLFSRTLLGVVPSLLLAASVSTRLLPPDEHIEHLRDFSKAPFITLLSALFIFLLTCNKRWIVPLAATSAVITAIGIGFRTDVSMFLAIIPGALLLRCAFGSDWRQAVAGIAVFSVVAVAYDKFILDYSAGMGRNTAHFALLGQGTKFTNQLNLGEDHQAGLYLYNDLFVHQEVRIFARNALMPDPEFATLDYDRASHAMFLDFTKMMPANILIEAFTAAYQSIFHSLRKEVGEGGQFGLFLISGLVLAARFHWRGIAVFGIATAVCGITAVQFDLRHYFHAETFGAIFLATLVAVAVTDVVRSIENIALKRSAIGSWVQSRMVPRVLEFRTIFGLGMAGVFAAFVLTLLGARYYQTARVAREIEMLAGSQRTALPVEPGSAPGTQVFSGASIIDSSYLGVVLQSASVCENFPRVDIEYEAADRYNNWSFTLRRPPGDLTATFFPVGKIAANSVRRIVASAVKPGCEIKAFIVTPTERFLPFVFYQGQLQRPAYLENSIIDTFVLRPGETWDVAFKKRDCVVHDRKLTAKDNVVSLDQPITVPDLLRFDVGDAKDGISSDHFNIGAASLEVDGKSWGLPNFAVAWDDHGHYGPLRNSNFRGLPLNIAGRAYSVGFGMHSPTVLVLRMPEAIKGKPGRLHFDYGIDGDTNGAGSVTFSACLLR